MPVGSFTLFRLGLLKITNSLVDLDADTFKMVLGTSSQAFTDTFVGSSTDARYADLTAELATAGGYTSGGATLSGISVIQSGAYVNWQANPISWTISSTITFKWGVIYDDTTPNKDLICFLDFDTGGGSVSPVSGILQVSPASSVIFRNSQ